MCLGVPAQIIALYENDRALIDIGGIRRNISVALLDEEVSLGDFVIIHVGYALSTLDQEEAEKTLQLFEDMMNVGE